MAMNRKMTAAAIVALATVAAGSPAHAELVSGWVVHNGTSVVTDGGTNAPTFTAADNITVMAPFSTISLTNDGDFITATTTLTMNGRTGNVGAATLNTQLRIGLFNGNTGAVVASDANNLGFIIEYSSLAAGGLIREQQSTSQTAPFVSPANIGNGVQDSGGDSIQGANPGPVNFELTLTRNTGKIDLAGKISGNDTVSGGAYLSTYAVTGYSSTNFPAAGTFSFNRLALFLGDGVNAASANLANAVVTNVAVPESRFGLLAVALLMGTVATGLKVRRAWRRGQPRP